MSPHNLDLSQSLFMDPHSFFKRVAFGPYIRYLTSYVKVLFFPLRMISTVMTGSFLTCS